MIDDRILERIKDVRNKAFYDANILIGQFGWDQTVDLRVRSLSKFIHLLIGLHLACCTLLQISQESDKYWVKLKLPQREKEDTKGYTASFEIFMRTGFVASLFSIVESSLRAYLSHLDPNQYKANLLRTEKIISVLLLQKLDRKYIYGLQWVDLLRNIRNTLHYNGVFTPPDGKPCSITYREKIYNFVPDERINFVDWALLLNLTDDLRGLFFQITTDDKIRTYTGIIPDPSQLKAA